MNRPDSPLVSVCVATYNHDRYIADCLTSVLVQLHDVPLEVLVGDDGDAVETPHIVAALMERYPGVIRYFKHERNIGGCANYQFLAEKAHGRYIAHLDGDDYWLPGKLRAQVDWLDAHPDSPACYSNAVVIDEAGVLLGGFSPAVVAEIDLPYLLEGGNFLNHSSMVYRSSHRDVVLGINGPFLDYRLHLGFARKGHLGFDSRPFVVYRKGSEHSTVRAMPAKVHALYFEALVCALVDSTVSRATRRAALVYFWRSIVLHALLTRRVGDLGPWSRKFKVTYPDDHLYVLTSGTLWAGWRVVRAAGRKLKGLFGMTHELRVLYER